MTVAAVPATAALNPKEVKVLRDYEYILKEVMGVQEDIWQIEDPDEYVRSYLSYYYHSTPGLLHAKVAPSTILNKLKTLLSVMRFQAPNITFTTSQLKPLLGHCENLLRNEDPMHSLKFNLYDTELDLFYTVAIYHPNTDYTQAYIVCALAWAAVMRPMSYIKSKVPRKLPAYEREKLEQLDPLRYEHIHFHLRPERVAADVTFTNIKVTSALLLRQINRVAHFLCGPQRPPTPRRCGTTLCNGMRPEHVYIHTATASEPRFQQPARQTASTASLHIRQNMQGSAASAVRTYYAKLAILLLKKEPSNIYYLKACPYVQLLYITI
jgi:hypothetical protein